MKNNAIVVAKITKIAKITIFYVALLSSSSYAQNLGQTQAADQTQNSGITQTQITHLTLTNKEQADHWQLSMDEWEGYQKYMELEGKYFYAHLDPITVLSLTTKDKALRIKYIHAAVLKERELVDTQVNFANDSFRVARELFGNEDLFDFNKLPQLDGKFRDKTIMYRENISDNMNDNLDNNLINKIETINMDDMNQIFFVIDAKCQNCQEPIQTLLDQASMQVVLVMKNSSADDITAFFKQYRLSAFVDSGRIKTRIYAKSDFPQKIDANLSDMFLGTNDQILKKIGN
ncbi:hypothetical protein AwWohl_01290 [Gammaproteobacteria bacterium]|nr:hypothetical protein AwWohl_01290 [Gammaproteobacteria bacterium]